MKCASLPVALLLALASGCASAEPAPPPVSGGLISTLPIGTYTCELAGDAGGLVGKPLPEYAFRVVNASAYKAGGIRGSYLLTGEYVTMTGGKLKGLKLHRLKDTYLRKVEADGSDSEMRCVRSSRR
ncbi:hypothetical protein [Novosphingobium kaempferiae]|uniref:hypothetical protein n=1 Tax=Novosphingobium kaempferiae TaxID=2896849 RepID=UPI001E5DFC77|nr:hypothetical protein [Novosphingobium kaempferiae]